MTVTFTHEQILSNIPAIGETTKENVGEIKEKEEKGYFEELNEENKDKENQENDKDKDSKTEKEQDKEIQEDKEKEGDGVDETE